MQGWDGWDETSLEPVRQLQYDEQNATETRQNKLISSDIITHCPLLGSISWYMSWPWDELQIVDFFPSSTIHNVFAREIRTGHRWRQKTQQRNKPRETWGTWDDSQVSPMSNFPSLRWLKLTVASFETQFYGLYKQATGETYNPQNKPSFWEMEVTYEPCSIFFSNFPILLVICFVRPILMFLLLHYRQRPNTMLGRKSANSPSKKRKNGISNSSKNSRRNMVWSRNPRRNKKD